MGRTAWAEGHRQSCTAGWLDMGKGIGIDIGMGMGAEISVGSDIGVGMGMRRCMGTHTRKTCIQKQNHVFEL